LARAKVNIVRLLYSCSQMGATMIYVALMLGTKGETQESMMDFFQL
jgi:hypothetical protein